MTMTPDEPMTSDCPAVIPSACKGIEAIVHPLVILNISDHWTRLKAQDPEKKPQNVYGAVLGRHEGRQIEMINSFELKTFMNGDMKSINDHFLTSMETQYKEVFPEMELIGWYSTGVSPPTQNDLLIQKWFASYVELPFLLKLDPAMASVSPKLPVTVWENAGAEACSTVGLRPVPWSLISEESERIGVDHVTRFSSKTGNQDESETAKHIRSNNAAVTMLVARIQMIHDYLVGVSERRLPCNNDIIREANKLVQRLPSLEPADFINAFSTQESDVNVALLLSKMTELCGSMGQLVNKVVLLSADRAPMANTPHKKMMMNMGGGSMFGMPQHPGQMPDLFNI